MREGITAGQAKSQTQRLAVRGPAPGSLLRQNQEQQVHGQEEDATDLLFPVPR
jgi:hypothetical protein